MFPLFLIIFFLFLLPSQSLSQEQQLEEIVVTATRVEEPIRDVPYSVQIISREEIKTSVAKDAGDLIVESAVGHVSKQPGELTTFYLRGHGISGLSPLDSRTLLLINGLRTATANIAMIPIDDIERVEIIKGPASVLYGSNAMGGVVNIITKKATEEGFHGSIGLEGGSWNRRKATGEFQFKKSNFDAYLSLSRSDGDDYETKKYGRYKNTGYNNESLSLRVGYEFLTDNRVSFGFKHYRGWEIGSPGSLSWLTPKDYVDHSLESFDIGYETKTFKTGYYFSKREYEYHDEWGGISLYKTKSQGVTFQKVFNISEHRLILGGEWNRVELENENTPPPPSQPKSKYDNFGLFSEGKIQIIKNLYLNLGARYDYFENELISTPGMTMTPKKENLDYLTVRGGAVYKLTDFLALRANAGTGFRAPSPTEYAGEYVTPWGKYIGNPSLKPEKSINYEGGLNFYLSGFNADFAFFHSVFKDKIQRYFNSDLNANTYKNLDKATIQGWELNLSYDLKNPLALNFSFKPFANITYHTRYSDSDGKSLLFTPKWLGAFGIRAHGKNWDTRLIANYVGDEYVNFKSSIVKKSDFTVVNFKALYRPIKEVEVSLGIENLFDRAYEYVLGYPMPRRTFTAGMKWLF